MQDLRSTIPHSVAWEGLAVEEAPDWLWAEIDSMAYRPQVVGTADSSTNRLAGTMAAWIFAFSSSLETWILLPLDTMMAARDFLWTDPMEASASLSVHVQENEVSASAVHILVEQIVHLLSAAKMLHTFRSNPQLLR